MLIDTGLVHAVWLSLTLEVVPVPGGHAHTSGKTIIIILLPSNSHPTLAGLLALPDLDQHLPSRRILCVPRNGEQE